MAVPQAVQQRMQREEQALREQGIDPNGPPTGVPAATVPTPQPTTPIAAPAPAAPAPDEMAALRTRNAELEAELRTQSGRLSARDREFQELKDRVELIGSNRTFLETNVGDLSTRNQELEAQIAELKAQGVSAQVQSAIGSLDESGPTEAQQKEYGDSIDFVNRVVNQRLAAIIKPLAADINEMKKQLGQVQAIGAQLPKIQETVKVADINNARAKEEQFLRAEVLPYFPDFETVRTTPEWKDYLAKDTGRGYATGHVLKSYRQTNDAVGIRSLIGAFYEQRKAKPTLDSLAVPAKSAADAPSPQPVPKMKASEYKANLKAMTGKKMSKADWDAYRARWDEALASGNVEMDTDLR